MGRKIAYVGIFTAMAVVIGFLEQYIPMPIPVPGVKPGLSNIVVLMAIETVGGQYGFLVAILKVLLSGVAYGGVSGIIYGLSGSILSVAVMVQAKKTSWFSIIGISVAGGVFHNIGQIILAAMVVQNIKLLYYLPILIVSGMIMGIITGWITRTILSYRLKERVDKVKI